MRGFGLLLVLLGCIAIILGIIRHFNAFTLQHTAHASIILGVIGLVVLIIGGLMAATGRHQGVA